MLLKIADEEYTIHFQHRVVEDAPKRRRWTTRCFFHAGRCAVKSCLGTTDPHAIGYGVAICNPIDQFSKAKGRIHSLTKALETLPRDFRQEVWKAYFEVVPR